MSMSCNYLRDVLQRPPPPPPFRPNRPRGGSPDLEQLIREGQNRFKRPHLRDYGYRMPMPFRWGPNGGLMLLGAMLAVYGFAVFVVLVVRGAP